MPRRIPWSERTFRFDTPVEYRHELLERLRGTPARVEEMVRDLPLNLLTKRVGSGWTIQENVGHLLDLETLFDGRLDDFDEGLDVLRAADMSNRKTNEAGHNDRDVDAILEAFRREREKTIQRLERLDPARFSSSAKHPRLEQPMRIVDMMYFQAEHDDYHLARITELSRLLTT